MAFFDAYTESVASGDTIDLVVGTVDGPEGQERISVHVKRLVTVSDYFKVALSFGDSVTRRKYTPFIGREISLMSSDRGVRYKSGNKPSVVVPEADHDNTELNQNKTVADTATEPESSVATDPSTPKSIQEYLLEDYQPSVIGYIVHQCYQENIRITPPKDEEQFSHLFRVLGVASGLVMPDLMWEVAGALITGMALGVELSPATVNRMLRSDVMSSPEKVLRYFKRRMMSALHSRLNDRPANEELKIWIDDVEEDILFTLMRGGLPYEQEKRENREWNIVEGWPEITRF